MAGSAKLCWFITNPPKYHLPTIFILSNLLCRAVNPSKLCAVVYPLTKVLTCCMRTRTPYFACNLLLACSSHIFGPNAPMSSNASYMQALVCMYMHIICMCFAYNLQVSC